jgi:tetratricopeptide (TPR) repeat protein
MILKGFRFKNLMPPEPSLTIWQKVININFPDNRMDKTIFIFIFSPFKRINVNNNMIIRMKTKLRNLIKTISLLFVVVISTTTIKAQGRNEVIEAYNEGAKAVQTDPQAAIKSFEKVVLLSKQVGDSAADLRQKAIKVLPSLYYNIAANAYTGKKPAPEIIQAAKKASAAAEKYDNISIKQNADIILVKAYNNMAGDYFSKDDYKGALAAFDSVLMINPDYSSAMYNKALIYIKQANSDDFEKTIDQYIEKVKAGNDEAKVKQASNLALGYFRASGSKSDQADKLDEALTFLNKSAKYGDDKDLFYYFAEVYNKKKNFDKGLDYARKGLVLESGDVEAKAKFYFQIALAQEGKGQTTEACESFKNATYGVFAAPSKAKRANLKCK